MNSMETGTSSQNADKRVLNLNTNSKDDASNDELNSFRVARQVTMLAHTQAPDLLRFQGAGLMTFETHAQDVEP